MKVLQHGQLRESTDVISVDRLLELKKNNPTNYWPVVEACLDIWIAKRPTEYKSFLVELQDMKQTRRNKFASSETEMYRYTLDVPEMVIFMLRRLYTTDEMPMDKKFFRSWAKKFPKMRVAEKI